MGKKTLGCAVVALGLCLGLTLPAQAANQVKEILVDVTLDSDGSAYVVQTWDGSFQEGTENYFPVTNLGDITLTDLTVSDGSGTYTTLDDWDTDGSLEDKAFTCGLLPVEDGYEVCWGISEYGDNRYAVEYRLGNLAAAYDESDGFLFQFIPSDMNTGPTDAIVRIQLRDGTPLTEENAAIWAFGYEGTVEFQDGAVVAYTQTALEPENSMILMMELPKQVIFPTRTVNGSFEDVKTRAFEGSDYGSEDSGSITIWLIVLAVGAVVIGLFFWKLGAEGRRIKKVYKTADYYREAPIGGNLEACFLLANRFEQSDDEGNLVAAALMRLLAEGCLEPLTETDVGFMGREKTNVSLRLVHAPTKKGLVTELLYELLTKAAGSDGILQEKELEVYCNRNYQDMLHILQEAKRDGGDTLDVVGCYKSLLNTTSLAGLTDRGRSLVLQLMGLKKYLLDFSLIAERGVNEAIIWQEYMTYAALLGIADKVMEQLRKLYPGNVNAYLQRTEITYYVAYRYHHVTYGSAKSAEAAAERTAGGGGFSSVGGGGGFSGGGSGGGSR